MFKLREDPKLIAESGMRARWARKGLEWANPYATTDPRWKDWRQGWLMADRRIGRG